MTYEQALANVRESIARYSVAMTKDDALERMDDVPGVRRSVSLTDAEWRVVLEAIDTEIEFVDAARAFAGEGKP